MVTDKFDVLKLITYYGISHDDIFVEPFDAGWSVPFRPAYTCTRCGACVDGDWNTGKSADEPREHKWLETHIKHHENLDSALSS